MENLLLLHGALGAAATLEPLRQLLRPHYQVYTLDFPGHGGRAIPDQPFSMALFVEDVLQYMEQERLERVHIFGYSMGGYVALYLALHHPKKVNSICTLATKFDWTPATAAKEAAMLNPERLQEKVPQFAAALAQRHQPQPWQQLLHKTAALLHDLGQQPPLTAENLAQLPHPVQVCLGDRDAMVTLEETAWAYRSLSNGRLAILPATKHPLETIPAEQLAHVLKQFFGSNTVT